MAEITVDAIVRRSVRAQAIGQQAQTTAQGRARLALAMAFLNTTDWDPTAPAPPDPADPDAVEAGQYGAEFGFPGFPIIPFTVTGRQQILALAQVVYTATELPSVDRVLFQIDGENVEVPNGNGKLTSSPLGRLSYRDLLASG